MSGIDREQLLALKPQTQERKSRAYSSASTASVVEIESRRSSAASDKAAQSSTAPEQVADQLADDNSRLAAENELLQVQVMQAHYHAMYAAAASMQTVQPYVNQDSYAFHMNPMMMPPWLPPQVPKRKVEKKAKSKIPETKSKESEAEAERPTPDGPPTTAMLKNLPANCTRDLLLQIIDSEGFARKYDFVYLPIDFKTGKSFCYAFVNLRTPEDAQHFMEVFEGFKKWPEESEQVCTVIWSTTYQGTEAHVERFRDSPVMHESVPEEHKPLLFDPSGERVPFPKPTKVIRAPRTRKGLAAQP